jgi:hypothetical protein
MGEAVTLAKQSDSTIITLLVVLALIIVALIPVMKTIASIDGTKRKQDFDREGRLIQVIEKNTDVNSALKMMIEGDQKHCGTCRVEQFNLFNRLFANQEIANNKLTDISHQLDKGDGV